MSRIALVAMVLAGCSFSHGLDPNADARDIGDGSGTEDSPGVCTAGFLDLCKEPAPTGPLDITGPDTINTDSDPRCRTLAQPNGGPVCLVYATVVNIGAGGSLTATGSRPLAIASTSAISIAGTIDVSSQRVTGQRGPAADDAACANAAAAESDDGGAGGGAGASFGGEGGDGGSGDTDLDTTGDNTGSGGRAGATTNVVSLRGGCGGGGGGDVPGTGAEGGGPGHSGGALYIFAPDGVDVMGAIRATGGGGDGGKIMPTGSGGGGGGGGSGGLIVIESKTIAIAATASISANGGGAGEGAFVGGSPRNGQPGFDGGYGTTPANGGRTQGIAGTGFGGAGGAGTTAASNGASSVAGGGGGGGGSGVIKLIGDSTLGGSVSPPPS